MDNQVVISKCCKNKPAYQITYFCGQVSDQIILVCEYHYRQELFQKCIKKMEKI